MFFTSYEIISEYVKCKSVFIGVLKYPLLKEITCGFNYLVVKVLLNSWSVLLVLESHI